MRRNPKLYLDDVLDAIGRIESYVDGLTQSRFGRDQKTIDAVIRCLEIISEASRRISEDAKAAHPEIPWSRIAGIGNILRHEYGSVSVDAVWDVVTQHLPPLKRAVQAIRRKTKSRARSKRGGRN